MALYTITATDVVYASKSVSTAIAGEALAAGDFVYVDSSTQKVFKAVANDTVAKAAVDGMCVCSADTDQPVNYVQAGEVEVGVIFGGAGRALTLSSTAGKIEDAADHSVGKYLTFIGWTTATNKLKLSVTKSGVQRA